MPKKELVSSVGAMVEALMVPSGGSGAEASEASPPVPGTSNPLSNQEMGGGAPNDTVNSDIALFNAKNDYLLHRTGYQVSEVYLRDFLSLVFERKVQGDDVNPAEEINSREYQLWLQQKEENRPVIDYSGYACWRYNPIVFYIDGKVTRKKRMEDGSIRKYQAPKALHRIVLKDDTETLDWLDNRQFAIASPVTYVGHSNTANNARFLYALAFDLDGVGMNQIHDLFYQIRNGHTPTPNIIVNSGHGLHLYYLLEAPVPLYDKNLEVLNRMKEGLTNVIWNEYTSTLEDRQYQTILQGFRLPGTLTKFGERVTAYHIEDAPMWTLSGLNRWLSVYKATQGEIDDLDNRPIYNPTGVTLSEAAKRWPEWYARVIVRKERSGAVWHVKRDLYDWWLHRLQKNDEKIAVHHRYWCVLTLVVYAVKCGITRDEVWEDAVALIPKMEKLTDSEDNHFTIDDVEAAFRAYDANYRFWPVHTIENTTMLTMPRNKRNGRKRAPHLKIMNFIRDNISFPDGSWRNKNGRPSQEAAVRAWRIANPGNENKSQCARDAKLDRKTVAKWWNMVL